MLNAKQAEQSRVHARILLDNVDSAQLALLVEELETAIDTLRAGFMTERSRIAEATAILERLEFGKVKLIRPTERPCVACGEPPSRFPHCPMCGLHHTNDVTCDDAWAMQNADAKMGDANP